MRIVIVGAGLAGLACALTVQAAGHTPIVLEASPRVGGRIGSVRRPDGFVIDRGFQVLFTHYPTMRRLVDLKALKLRPFMKGAVIHHEGRFVELSNPFERPAEAWQALFAPFMSLTDALVAARITLDVVGRSDDDLRHGPHLGTSEGYLRGLGLSEGALQRFIRPFFGGVFLDRSLTADARLFRFYWKMLVVGATTVPEEGMQALPDQLAARLAPGTIRLETAVKAVQPDAVTLASGEVVRGDAVVLAVPYPELRRLTGFEHGFQGNPSTTYYYAGDRPITDAPIIVLAGDADGPINMVATLTAVSAAYAPEGSHLHAVQIVGGHSDDQEARVREQLARWFPKHDTAAWRLLEVVDTPFGQFRETQEVMDALPGVRLGDGLYLASELTTQSSIEGALSGGERAAQAVLADLGARITSRAAASAP